MPLADILFWFDMSLNTPIFQRKISKQIEIDIDHKFLLRILLRHDMIQHELLNLDDILKQDG